MTHSTDWHHFFGIALIDYFLDTNYHVELEKELSHKKQRIDVIIIEATPGPPLSEVPDGLETLSKHNLLTYKSHQQPLDAWALDELVGHYVNYRKQTSPSLKQLLPAADFRFYAVSARYPQKLAAEVTLHELQAGVYETLWGPHPIRVIVLSKIPEAPRNTLWHLFSGRLDYVEYARQHHLWRDPDTRGILAQMYERYINEEVFMSYTMEDFRREHKRFLLRKFKENPEEYLQELSPEEIIKRLSLKDRLQGLSPDDIVQELSPEDILKRLPPEVIEAHLVKWKAQQQ